MNTKCCSTYFFLAIASRIFTRIRFGYKLKILFYIYMLMLYSFFLLASEQIVLKVNDADDYRPLPFVILQTEQVSVISDSLGYFYLNSLDEPLYTFFRKGYKQVTKTREELLKNSTIRMQIAYFTQESIIVQAERETNPFRMSSEMNLINLENSPQHYSSIQDVLRDINPNLIQGNNLIGERQIASLGGHQGRHTIIILDNIILNPAGQALDLSSIPLSQISSVEIVQNNTSTDTGSGGQGGMIVIQTKRIKHQSEIEVKNNFGSFNNHQQFLRFNYQQLQWGVQFYLTQAYADNNYPYKYKGKDEKKENNQNIINQFTTDFNFKNLLYSFKYQIFRKELPGPIKERDLYWKAFQQGTVIHHNVVFANKISLFPEPFMGMQSYPLQYEVQTYGLFNESTYQNTKAPVQFYHAKFQTKQDIKGFKSAISQKFLGDYFELHSNLGGEIRNESLLINDLLYQLNSLPQVDQTTRSIFSSQSVKNVVLLYYEPEIRGSYRLDHHGNYTYKSSWRTEINQKFTYYLPVRLNSNLGTSYTIPSFYDLYWKGDAQTNGNPDLQPEESLGWRIEGILGENPFLGLAYWHNRTKNLIYWNRNNIGWKPFNLMRAEITNWEIFGKFTFFQNYYFDFNYIRTEALNKTPDEYLFNKKIIYTPIYHWNAKLNGKIKFLEQSISYYAQGKQWKTNDQLYPALPGYDLWYSKTVISMPFQKIKSSFSLNWNNIFDTRYENYADMPEPGRNWEISFNLNMPF